MDKFKQENLESAEVSKSSLDKIEANHPEIFALISNSYNPESSLSVSENEIVTSEGNYLNIPRMQELVRIVEAIKENLPPVPENHVRLWRGNRQNEVGKNPSYTNSLAGIALPFLMDYHGPLSYIDIPNELSEKFLVTRGGAKGAEFMIPDELLSNIKIVGLSENETADMIQKSAPEEKMDPHDSWTTIKI